MKNSRRIAVIVLLLITLVCMFLPIAHFDDQSADALAADITKQSERVQSAQAKLERDTKSGKDEATLNKQKDKIAKEQAKLDDLLAKQAEAAQNAAQSGLSYSLLPGKLPIGDELSLDMEVINFYKIYPADGMLGLYHGAIYAAAALLVLGIVLICLGGNKVVSKFFTFAGLANLLAFVVLAYVVLRLNAFPIKLPYSNPIMHWPLAAVLLVCPLAAMFLNIGVMENTKRTMIYILCTLLSILSILPFWIMIVNATRSTVEIQSGVSLLPSSYLANNWSILTKKNFNIWIGFKNSAIISFSATLLSVYFSALTAYGLTVYKFKGAKQLYAIILAIIMIPGQVTATGFYMFMYRINWINSYWPLIIPSIAAASTVFFFKQYLEANFQISLVEAARIDGAGEFRIYNTIIMPIMVPAMATMGIMAVIASWNNYLTPLMLLSNPEMKTLPMMVKELRGDIYRTEFGSIYLGLSLTALPLIIVYFALSKYIIAGVAVGGVKE